MEYVQEHVTTLHDLADPPAVTGLAETVAETAVVVPLTDRACHGAAERVFETLGTVGPADVVVPVRAPADRIEAVRSWLADFEVPTTVLWCSAPDVSEALAEAGIEDGAGKGRDVWLALGVASEAAEVVAIHDADAVTYSSGVVPRLVAPIAMGFGLGKGYYARVEERLYGRLQRLFVSPFLEAVAQTHGGPVVGYLRAFRYLLSGEVAMTAGLARRLRPPPGWGLEVATLGDAHGAVGPDGVAQVDLGRHAHDHRSVTGDAGLADMSEAVGAALARVLESRGLELDYGALRDRTVEAGDRLVEQYGADARFNGLAFDASRERDQVRTYATGIGPPGPDRRLPAWRDEPVPVETVRAAARPWA